MEIREEKVNDVEILKLEGRLDASSAKDIKEKVDLLTKENRIKLVIDMGGIEFIDSSGARQSGLRPSLCEQIRRRYKDFCPPGSGAGYF